MSRELERLLLYGAGGHAKSVITAIEAENRYRIAAVVEDGTDRVGWRVLGYEVVGGQAALSERHADGVRLAAVAIGDNSARARISSMLAEVGFELTTVMHPLAWVAPGSRIGAGSFIHVYAVVGPDCRIGNGTIISAHSVVGHDSHIDDWVHITPGVRIGGNVVIGRGAFLGMGCSVLPGMRIGKNASIGANSVVHKDIPDNAIVAGNPPRRIRSE